MKSSKLVLIILLLIAIPMVSSTDCFPNYECGHWSKCDSGLKSRTCTDTKCGKRDIMERDICGESLDCTPNIDCQEWSECVYTDKTNDLVGGEIGFGGYKTRQCSDLNGCVKDYSEEDSCQEAFNLNLRKIKECNQEFVVASDTLSGREIAKINVDSWDKNRLDIIFTQGETVYCPSCYDGVLNNDETGIDCGGSCKECKVPALINIISLFTMSLWVLFILFTALAGVESIPLWKSKKSIRQLKKLRKRKF